MRKFFRSFKDISIVYKKSRNAAALEKYREYKIDVNWIGEPYYSFQVPDEFFESEVTLNSYVWKKMEDTYHVFQNLYIDQYLYPVTYVDHKNHTALIHMIVNKKPIIKGFRNIFFTLILGVVLYSVYNIYFLK